MDPIIISDSQSQPQSQWHEAPAYHPPPVIQLSDDQQPQPQAPPAAPVAASPFAMIDRSRPAMQRLARSQGHPSFVCLQNGQNRVYRLRAGTDEFEPAPPMPMSFPMQPVGSPEGSAGESPAAVAPALSYREAQDRASAAFEHNRVRYIPAGAGYRPVGDNYTKRVRRQQQRAARSGLPPPEGFVLYETRFVRHPTGVYRPQGARQAGAVARPAGVARPTAPAPAAPQGAESVGSNAPRALSRMDLHMDLQDASPQVGIVGSPARSDSRSGSEDYADDSDDSFISDESDVSQGHEGPDVAARLVQIYPQELERRVAAGHPQQTSGPLDPEALRAAFERLAAEPGGVDRLTMLLDYVARVPDAMVDEEMTDEVRRVLTVFMARHHAGGELALDGEQLVRRLLSRYAADRVTPENPRGKFKASELIRSVVAMGLREPELRVLSEYAAMHPTALGPEAARINDALASYVWNRRANATQGAQQVDERVGVAKRRAQWKTMQADLRELVPAAPGEHQQEPADFQATRARVLEDQAMQQRNKLARLRTQRRVRQDAMTQDERLKSFRRYPDLEGETARLERLTQLARVGRAGGRTPQQQAELVRLRDENRAVQAPREAARAARQAEREAAAPAKKRARIAPTLVSGPAPPPGPAFM